MFYVKELVEPPKANGTYGPLAYGLSAFSPTLVDTEAFADGVIGIHGTNRPELIGSDVSHGCVRLRNEDVLDLEQSGRFRSACRSPSRRESRDRTRGGRDSTA